MAACIILVRVGCEQAHSGFFGSWCTVPLDGFSACQYQSDRSSNVLAVFTCGNIILNAQLYLWNACWDEVFYTKQKPILIWRKGNYERLNGLIMWKF